MSTSVSARKDETEFRAALRSGPWSELFLNPAQAAKTHNAAEAIAFGHSVLMGGLASTEECIAIASLATASAAMSAKRDVAAPGEAGYQRSTCIRMPVQETFDAAGQALCEELLMRALRFLATELPSTDGSLLLALFGGTPASLLGNRRLSFSQGEPAVNVYREGAEFKPHEDKHSLTVLVTLTGEDAFVGGGTAFWSLLDRGPNSSLRDINPPTITLRPPLAARSSLAGP